MDNKKYHTLQMLVKKLFALVEPSPNKPETPKATPAIISQTEGMISASSQHPLISTLVYKDASVDHLISETFNQEKMMVNAAQILASLDHTTASKH
ncbi:MAG: hypothetical protein AABY33_10630 [Pseudomonadota bacterium]